MKQKIKKKANKSYKAPLLGLPVIYLNKIFQTSVSGFYERKLIPFLKLLLNFQLEKPIWVSQAIKCVINEYILFKNIYTASFLRLKTRTQIQEKNVLQVELSNSFCFLIFYGFYTSTDVT